MFILNCLCCNCFIDNIVADDIDIGNDIECFNNYLVIQHMLHDAHVFSMMALY